MEAGPRISDGSFPGNAYGWAGGLGFASTALLLPLVWRCAKLKFSGTLRVDSGMETGFFCDCWQFPTQPLLSPLASFALGLAVSGVSYLLFHVL